jgi:hypothetical protein
MTPDQKQFEDEILLGDDIEALLGKPIGDYLVRRAQQDIDATVEALKNINPQDTGGVMRLQERIRMLEQFHVWLADAITAGKANLAALAESESEC